MNSNFEPLFYDSIAFISAAMVVVNIGRVKSRGLSAILLAVAFLFFGASVYVLSRYGTIPIVYVGGTIVFLCLVGDFIYRASKLPPANPKGKRK